MSEVNTMSECTHDCSTCQNKCSSAKPESLLAPQNAGSNIPRFQTSYTGMTSTSDRWLTDASYLTLGNITLGYTLPKNLLKKAQIESLRVYVVADNIYTWSKRQGLDPRQDLTGGSNAQMYSPIRTFSAGVNLTF